MHDPRQVNIYIDSTQGLEKKYPAGSKWNIDTNCGDYVMAFVSEKKYCDVIIKEIKKGEKISLDNKFKNFLLVDELSSENMEFINEKYDINTKCVESILYSHFHTRFIPNILSVNRRIDKKAYTLDGDFKITILAADIKEFIYIAMNNKVTRRLIRGLLKWDKKLTKLEIKSKIENIDLDIISFELGKAIGKSQFNLIISEIFTK